MDTITPAPAPAGSAPDSPAALTLSNRRLIGVIGLICLAFAGPMLAAFGGKILPTALPEPTPTLIHSGWIPAVTYSARALLVIVLTGDRLAYPPEMDA